MTHFDIKANTGNSKIILGESIQDLYKYITNAEHTVIITDENVNNLYKHLFPSDKVITIGMGEKNKTIKTLELIFTRLLEFGADRSTFLLGIGGGIVCDTAGFVASTFMRGIDFAFAPTTLLAQVDASIGGKNGVNFLSYKNMIGVFNQPKFVLADFEVLRTLNKRELACGLAEIIKHALITDKSLFEFLENNSSLILSLNPDAILRIVEDSVIIKSKIVEKDECEKGERRKLNFGHTFGHAIEKVLKINHGEAVSAGMMFAADFSKDMGFLKEDDVKRIENLLKLYNLPVYCSAAKDQLIDAVKKDKKKSESNLHFVFLNNIGSSLVKEIKIETLEKRIKKLN